MEEASAETPPTPRLGVHDISPGGCHPGWVREVGPDGLWVSLSPAVTGRIVPLRANHSPHALHSDRTPFGPLRINGVACDVHPQLEHARPVFLPPAIEDVFFCVLIAGGGSGGSTGGMLFVTLR